MREFHSWIGSSTPDSITVGGLDLPSEVMGRLTLTDLAYLLVTHREPTASERRMLDAVLVALAMDWGTARSWSLEDVWLEASYDCGDKLKADLDDMLDEIDGVLETNAEDFVKSYVQKGGQ